MLLVLALAIIFSGTIGATGEQLGLDHNFASKQRDAKREISLLDQCHEYMDGFARSLWTSGEHSCAEA